MIRKVFKMLRLFLNKKYKEKLNRVELGYSLVSDEKSYLVETGFVHSLLNDSLTTSDGEYVPWMNYPTIEFLKERLNKNMVVFEYGSGASTLFFAKRTNKVYSVEYDKFWYDKISALLSTERNSNLFYQELNADYSKSIGNVEENKMFDVVVVDGRDRVLCAKIAVDFLKKNGVLIFDDTHRDHYKEGVQYCIDKGFKKLVFKGQKPTGIRMCETTILYRSDNCFNI